MGRSSSEEGSRRARSVHLSQGGAEGEGQHTPNLVYFPLFEITPHNTEKRICVQVSTCTFICHLCASSDQLCFVLFVSILESEQILYERSLGEYTSVRIQ